MGITARVHLLNHEFCTVNVMPELDRKRARFFMAVVRNSKIARAVAAARGARLAGSASTP